VNWGGLAYRLFPWLIGVLGRIYFRKTGILENGLIGWGIGAVLGIIIFLL